MVDRQQLHVLPASAVRRDLLRDVRARVTRVRVLTAQRTQDAALTAELHPLFDVRTLDELVDKTYKASVHVREMGLFAACLPVIDIDPSTVDGYHVLLLAEEPKPVRAGMSVGVDNTAETQATFSAETRSASGRGESLSMQATGGVRGTSLFNASFAAPLLGWQRHTSLGVNMFRSHTHHLASLYEAVQTGANVQVSHRTNAGIHHTFALHGVWRHLMPAASAAFSVRSCAGHSLKQSFAHTVGLSNEDTELLPTRGICVKLTHELAGGIFGGSVHHLMQRLDARATTTLPFGNIILSTSARLSRVLPQRARPPLSMIDRLYLGGPTDLRGFGPSAAGPVENGTALGGNALWAAAVHAYRPLFPPRVLYAHAFAVAGNVVSTDGGSEWRELSQRARATCGVGVAVRVGEFVRLELNYCVPLCVQAGDSAVAGVQFGAGIDFL